MAVVAQITITQFACKQRNNILLTYVQTNPCIIPHIFMSIALKQLFSSRLGSCRSATGGFYGSYFYRVFEW